MSEVKKSKAQVLLEKLAPFVVEKFNDDELKRFSEIKPGKSLDGAKVKSFRLGGVSKTGPKTFMDLGVEYKGELLSFSIDSSGQGIVGFGKDGKEEAKVFTDFENFKKLFDDALNATRMTGSGFSLF